PGAVYQLTLDLTKELGSFLVAFFQNIDNEELYTGMTTNQNQLIPSRSLSQMTLNNTKVSLGQISSSLGNSKGIRGGKLASSPKIDLISDPFVENGENYSHSISKSSTILSSVLDKNKPRILRK